jgi:hypothetical protein
MVPIRQREPRPYQSTQASLRASPLNLSKATTNQQRDPSNTVMSNPRKRNRGDHGVQTMFPAQEQKVDSLHAARERRTSNVEVVDHDDDDDIRLMTKEEEAEVIDVDELENDELVEEMFGGPLLPTVKNNATSSEVPPPWVTIDWCTWTSPDTHVAHTLKSGKVVELRSLGNFVQITSVIQNLETDEIQLRGLPLKRSRQVDAMLPKRRNEVCFIYDMDQDDPRSALEQSIIEVKLSQIMKIRKLICTNRPFPECRYDMVRGQAMRKSMPVLTLLMRRSMYRF